MPLLDIRNLTIEFMTAEGPVKAVDRINLTLNEGEVRGLVGESGSGKSLVAKAICGVTKDNWRVTADRMVFDDIDLLRLSPRERAQFHPGLSRTRTRTPHPSHSRGPARSAAPRSSDSGTRD